MRGFTAMPRKAKNSASAPDLLGTAPNIPQTPKKVVERTETQSAPSPAPSLDPNAIMFDEYGIDGQCANIPAILKAILCEMIRGRK